jgi:dTMP kinase
VRPDLTILLDGEPVRLAGRRALRGVTDRYEEQGLAYQERLRQGFLTLAAAEPKRIKLVNAEGTQEQVAAQVRRVLEAFLQEA